MAVVKAIFVVAAILQTVWCHSLDDHHANVGIIGGHQIKIEQAPYMASIRLDGTYHWCGGSIIHEQYILTAAHCIELNRSFKILVGTDKISGDGELYEIEEIKIHDEYNKRTNDFDVALIKLRKPLTFGPKVGKISLTTEVNLRNWMHLNVTGWGSTKENGPVSPNLLQVAVPLISARDCDSFYISYYIITENMICAGSRGHDFCQHEDTGGPLTFGNVQVGITSFGRKCELDPGVYARVSTALPWIKRECSCLD